MFPYAGKTALITGASSGIGEAFAHILAACGMHLVLVARSADKLRVMAQALSEQHGIRVEVVPADLSSEGAAQEVYRRTQALGVINVASIAAFQPVPYQAVFGASKAFVLSFSLALWAEYRKQGVRVVALCPGPTATNFFTVLGADDVLRLSKMHTPEAVVVAGLRALEQARPYAVEGRRNAFGAQVTHMTPLALTARVFERVMRPRKQEAQPGGESDDSTGELGQAVVPGTASKSYAALRQ
jgi:uncharacterized protein